MNNHTPTNRGRTGHEGNSVKAFGLLAAVAGLVWLLISWIVLDGAVAFALPVLLSIAGVVAFLIGRSMARPLASSSR